MKSLLALCLALPLSGCGSIITVLRDDSMTSEQLTKAKSYCGAVPRVYSGVMFDFCMLHAPPKEENNTSSALAIGMLADAAVSGVADTILLPYTLIRQHQTGSIEVN